MNDGLTVLGGLHPDSGPYRTILLLGPSEHFWRVFQASPEAQDGRPDPIDRWSKRVVGARAQGATALFPFGGPPYQPFMDWALQSGRCYASPVQLLVHAQAGLFGSFRGALAYRDHRDIPPALPNPCDNCAEKPCLTACPADALNNSHYDVAACHVFLDSEDGGNCMARGCAVRRSCPVGDHLRAEAQSAFHMSYFHRKAAP